MSKLSKIEITEKIRRGEIDCNNQYHFFGILVKGLMWKLKQDMKIRDIPIPHIIISTGDEIMYLEKKGQDQSLEPFENINEDYIYNVVPRCVVSPKGVNMQSDQLTSPYASGQFQIDIDDQLITYVAEFRRMPLKFSVELQYVTDTYMDFLELVQQIISKLCYIRNFSIDYMGQKINCSYSVPEAFDGEHMVDFDMATTEDRKHKVTLSLEIDTNIPVFNCETAVPADEYISTYKSIVTPITYGELNKYTE